MEKITHKQLVEVVEKLWRKMEMINDRTKLLTLKDRDRKKENKELESKLNTTQNLSNVNRK